MIDQTLEWKANDFLAVAVRHGLLKQLDAVKILEHAQHQNVQPSDAALTLSMLELFEVDAIHLLCNPTGLAPSYELIELIGCGAAGLVFRARQITLGREVALKTINVRSHNASTTGQSRIQREAHAIARLQHPNIVAAFDSGFYQGRFCISMELVEGTNLAEYIERNSPVPEFVAWRIARQAASALSHACQFGIIHRDIKPANLLLCEAPAGTELPVEVPFVKIADFGLALESGGPEGDHLTATGVTLGTPAYVAPEQLQDTHVDQRADIYSLGATVFHMLSGKAPGEYQSPMRTIMQKTIGDDRWRDDLPPSVSVESVTLFRNMTEKDPGNRIQNYQDLIQRIDALLAGSTVPGQKPPLSKPTKSESRHKNLTRRIILAITLTALAGLGIALWMTYPNLESPPIADASGWIVDGFPRALFDGQSVPLFRQSGNWSAGIASDGSRVLIGAEDAKMIIPLELNSSTSPNMRLRLGVNYGKESVVEIGVRHADQTLECAMLRFQNETIDFVPSEATCNSSDPKSLHVQSSAEEDVVFQQVAFQRQGDQVLLVVNGQTLGSIGCTETDATAIHLRCITKSANFADIDLVSLVSKTVSDR